MAAAIRIPAVAVILTSAAVGTVLTAAVVSAADFTATAIRMAAAAVAALIPVADSSAAVLLAATILDRAATEKTSAIAAQSAPAADISTRDLPAIEAQQDAQNEASARAKRARIFTDPRIFRLRWNCEAAGPSLRMANGAHSETAAIPPVSPRAARHFQRETRSGIPLETAEISLLPRRADHRIPGKAPPAGAGIVLAAKRPQIISDRPRSRGTVRPDGLRIAAHFLLIAAAATVFQGAAVRRFPRIALWQISSMFASTIHSAIARHSAADDSAVPDFRALMAPDLDAITDSAAANLSSSRNPPSAEIPLHFSPTCWDWRSVSAASARPRSACLAWA